ncbi:hypothetical protein LTR53_013985 [Teratosphaeriaceae sp. CCFEE 6253]|nr:hypothetical protein LTR53_013985 [Teratosphaeriaceae sp. CCFEE 6253]
MPDSTTAAAKRACDACHRRKVKCIGDGSRPCKNCTSAALTCTYNAVPQKKGPKGSRAKVISELRETQRQTQLVAAHLQDLPPHAAPYLPQSGLISVEMMTTCVDYFFKYLYPTQPILHRVKVGETIGQMETDVEAYCLILSLCAYMMIQPNAVLPTNSFEGLEISPQSSYQLGQLLLQEVLRVRKSYDYVECPTIWTVITSFFIFGSYFCLDKHNTAWFHLREATTLAQVMAMHDESSYQSPDVPESSRRRRLYWLLFVTERAYALQKHRPLTLQATINLPTLQDDPSETVELNGFIHLVNLFRPFDDTFVGVWNKTREGCTSQYLAQLQQQLSDALPVYLNSTESQAVDLRCSQQWLRMMVWQLSMNHGFLSSAAPNNAMSFTFPIEVSRDLVTSAGQFSQQAMEVHGIGLIEKLFDVACTLADVMSCVPWEQFGFAPGPRDYLNQLLALISSLRGGQQRYTPLLVAKISESMPALAIPGYSLPAAAGLPDVGSAFEEAWESSQAHSSDPDSSESTPWGSPPLGAAHATFGFRDAEGRVPAAGFQTSMAGMQYADLTAPSPAQFFQDVTLNGYPGSGLKHESDG